MEVIALSVFPVNPANDDYAGFWRKDATENDMKELDLDCSKINWISYILGHLFADEPNWTNEIENTFLKQDIESIGIFINNKNLIMIRKYFK